MLFPPIMQDANPLPLENPNEKDYIGCRSAPVPGKAWAGCLTHWFTNNTIIPGEPIMPKEFLRVTKPRPRYFMLSPWHAAGTAPVYGEGCGLLGGNPDGCPAKGGVDSRPPGSTCGGYINGVNGGGRGGGGFTGGKPALSYTFPNSTVTSWVRGTVMDVVWASKGHHAGGYSYRLCKIPAGGLSGVTEACFKAGTLDFSGDVQWTYVTSTNGPWVESTAVRTREGTFPAGSQWTKVPNPGWTFKMMKDLVAVPADIPTGSYILSFRWDSERTPQVWNGCSLVDIV